MRAIVQTIFGGPDVLHFADVPTPTPGPTPGPRDLLVKVSALSVNPVDGKARGGGPPAQSLDISGQILNRVADLLDAGVLETTLAQEMSWREVQAAHRAIETAHTAGKIVLRIE